MGFGDKIKTTISKIKGRLIGALILWLGLVIVFVAPMGIAVYDGSVAAKEGKEFSESFFASIGTNIVKPGSSIVTCISGGTHGKFFQVLWPFTLIYFFAIIVGFIKAIPKHSYEGIENGSSDWCVNGEQYSVLSNKKGIILAEKNYLPVDKRGNVNVLVVGRFWCW